MDVHRYVCAGVFSSCFDEKMIFHSVNKRRVSPLCEISYVAVVYSSKETLDRKRCMSLLKLDHLYLVEVYRCLKLSRASILDLHTLLLLLLLLLVLMIILLMLFFLMMFLMIDYQDNQPNVNIHLNC